MWMSVLWPLGWRGRSVSNSLRHILNSEIWHTWCPGGTSAFNVWSSRLQSSPTPWVVNAQCLIPLRSVGQVMGPWTLLSHIPRLVPVQQDIGWFGCVSLSVTCLELSNPVKWIVCITHLNQALPLPREMSQLCGNLLFWNKTLSAVLSHTVVVLCHQQGSKTLISPFFLKESIPSFCRWVIFSASWSHLEEIHAWFEENGKGSCYISLIWGQVTV